MAWCCSCFVAILGFVSAGVLLKSRLEGLGEAGETSNWQIDRSGALPQVAMQRPQCPTGCTM
jgi:hypothetical protein